MWRPMDPNMRFRHFAFVALLFAAPVTARETIGTFATWTAFCDEPRRCFAVSVPTESRGRPSAAVGITRAALQIQIHLGRPSRAAALLIGDRRFELDVEGQDARASIADSRRIVAAIREEPAMTLVGTSAHGGRFRHHYDLRGAPSAIDAALIASLR